jgi:crossover junction endodeoxyribonuclease RusA
MADRISFTVLGKPEPQGSVKAFVLPGKDGGKPRAILTSDNTKMKPYRQQLGWAAMDARAKAGYTTLFAEQHVAVQVEMKFFFSRPPSIKKSRIHIVVKPDIDKLCRSSIDAMTGILFADDAQVIKMTASKEYGIPERAEITVTNLECVTPRMFDEKGMGAF